MLWYGKGACGGIAQGRMAISMHLLMKFVYLNKPFLNIIVYCDNLRKAAKVLQQKLQTITDSEERKQLARQMNDLFAEASQLMKEAKNNHRLEESIEREFLGIQANLGD